MSVLQATLKFTAVSTALQILIFVTGLVIYMAVSGVGRNIGTVIADGLAPGLIGFLVLYAVAPTLFVGFRLQAPGWHFRAGVLTFLIAYCAITLLILIKEAVNFSELSVRDSLVILLSPPVASLCLLPAAAAALKSPHAGSPLKVGLFAAAITALYRFFFDVGFFAVLIVFMLGFSEWKGLDADADFYLVNALTVDLISWLLERRALPFEPTADTIYGAMLFPGFLVAGLIAALASMLTLRLIRPSAPSTSEALV